jgi:prophage regulatory protein
MGRIRKRVEGTQPSITNEQPNTKARLITTLAGLETEAAALHARIQGDVLVLEQLHRRMLIALTDLCDLPTGSIKARPAPTEATFLRLPRVMARVGLSRSAIWRMVKDEQFPQPQRLSTRAVGWSSHEIELWIRERKRL